MDANNDTSGKEKERPVLTLIQQIKDGQVDPETMGKELRQQCIEVFLCEGYAVPLMAQILRKCEKTVRRDLDEIRARNALSPSVDFAKKLVGEIVMSARVNRDHLMRLARLKDTSVAEKSQAEYYAHRVNMELTEKLQSLGYLPLKPKTIVADFTHTVQVNDEAALDDLKAQIIEIERLAADQGGLTPGLDLEVQRLRNRVGQLEVENSILKITDSQKKEESSNVKREN